LKLPYFSAWGELVETIKVKQNRFGTFYVATRTLMVKGKAFKVKQTRRELNDERGYKIKS